MRELNTRANRPSFADLVRPASEQASAAAMKAAKRAIEIAAANHTSLSAEQRAQAEALAQKIYDQRIPSPRPYKPSQTLGDLLDVTHYIAPTIGALSYQLEATSNDARQLIQKMAEATVLGLDAKAYKKPLKATFEQFAGLLNLSQQLIERSGMRYVITDLDKYETATTLDTYKMKSITTLLTCANASATRQR